MPHIYSSLNACLAIIAVWGLIGLAGLLRPTSLLYVGRTLFPLGALCGVALAVVAATSLQAPVEQAVLSIGLPDLPMHVRRDALSSLFLVLLGATSAGISIFAAGYFRRGAGTSAGLMCLQYHFFLASMGFVLLADDAYAFMVAWETMALSSYFLVTTQHGLPEIRRAGFLYLLIAHVGALAILLSFGLMQGGSWQFTFDAMRTAHLAPHWAAVAFLLALFGFGAKAGLVPLHVWLPEAHPAAPSPVSALMSAVMLKTAVYGVLRVTFDLLGKPDWWWGLVLLAIGLFSALYGVIFAAVQTDMKRLLAWSSIENLGIIFTGIGLAVVFHGVGMNALAALALIAALYHTLNHAFMKSLLFLGTGSVLHSTGERNLGRLGGLIHRMPWVAWLTLVGALAMAGLPPLNGFVSEWLLLQAFLFAHEVPRSFVSMMLPVGAALVALSAALAAYVMVKFFGVIFLGQFFLWRQRDIKRLFAYSSIEHMGIISFAFGMGGPVANFAALLHMTVHSLTKSAIFFAAGHAAQKSGSQLMENIRGLITLSPTVGWGLMMGSLAILGMPPFGVFASEFLILTTAMREQPWATPILLVALGVAFAAIFGRVQPMVFGETTAKRLPHPPALLPVFAHLAIVLLLGIYVPPYLADWYRAAALLIGGQ